MWSFLAELFRRQDGPCTVLLTTDDYWEEPLPYRIHPRAFFGLLGGSVLGLTLVLIGLLVFTPLRELIPGYGSVELQDDARSAVLRLAAMEDSLQVQQEYMAQLRQLMTGQFDTTQAGPRGTSDDPLTLSDELVEVATEPMSQDWADHEQPALSVGRMPIDVVHPIDVEAVEDRYLSSLQLPAVPPLSGLLTRGFDARTGHYAVDIATKEGTMVRAIGEGYVIFADWTHEGGYAVVVQHADGYVSIYKHNERLLKHIGDRVHAREALAVSGNSGEFTTGPHLHFELWNNGFAQDPRHYLVGL